MGPSRCSSCDQAWARRAASAPKGFAGADSEASVPCRRAAGSSRPLRVSSVTRLRRAVIWDRGLPRRRPWATAAWNAAAASSTGPCRPRQGCSRDVCDAGDQAALGRVGDLDGLLEEGAGCGVVAVGERLAVGEQGPGPHGRAARGVGLSGRVDPVEARSACPPFRRASTRLAPLPPLGRRRRRQPGLRRPGGPPPRRSHRCRSQMAIAPRSSSTCGTGAVSCYTALRRLAEEE
jgi:hypothetical protein